MQNIIIDQPYRFVSPCFGTFWHGVIQLLLPGYLSRCHGVENVQCRGLEHLKRSLQAGHGLLLTPNHCRPCDPMVLGMLSKAVGRPFFVMASWHLFVQGRLKAWLLRRAGAFSVYREGMDREALRAAITILQDARRPLVLFPEGVITRTNDRLGHLMEGTAFIARSAAKQRAALQPPGQVMIHPVAIRYHFGGNLEGALGPVLDEIEARLTWRSPGGLGLRERIHKVGAALLGLKELEYLGGPQSGAIGERIERLIDCLLAPLEQEWLKGEKAGDVVARVKRLRTAILPDLVGGELTESERARRWRQLADLYLAQQLWCYPPDYVSSRPTPERLLETVERFEEDLTDRTRIHRPLRAVIEVGEPVAVSPGRNRGAGGDTLMDTLRERLEGLLGPHAAREPGPI